MEGATNSKTRVVNAFRAMKDLGISESKVKPVLKSLLKLYDKNWQYIEAENYRVLADAIFEREEADAQENAEKVVNDEVAQEQPQNTLNAENNLQKETETAEEPERPLKRIRRGSRGVEASSSNATNSGLSEHTTLLKPKDEPNEFPEAHPPNTSASSQGKLASHLPNAENFSINSQDDLSRRSSAKKAGKQPVSPSTSIAEEPNDGVCQAHKGRKELQTPCHSMKLRGRGTTSVSSQDASKEKRSTPDTSSKQNGDATTHTLIEPKDEPVTDDTPFVEAATRAKNPETSNDSDPSNLNCTKRKACNSPQPVSLSSINEHEKDCGAPSSTSRKLKANGELTKNPSQYAAQLEIASSLSGKVKISFIYDMVSGMPGTNTPPSLGAVTKFLEAKYLLKCTDSGVNMSVMDLMKDMCEFFLKSGTIPSDGALLPTKMLFPSPRNGLDDESNENSMGQKSEANTERATQKQVMLAPEIGTSLNFSVDVAKGHETVVISLVNEVNDEPPPYFHYIPQNIVFQNAYLHFSLARIADENCCPNCDGDCLSSAIPCACAHETGGEFAYTVDGLVREDFLKECISMNREPKRHCQFFCKECPLERSKKEDGVEACKGHLVRKFIKECWQKCGCDMQCGNRVVQRGITRNLQVFMSPGGKGWGLRTLEDLPKGAFVCEYVGEVLTNTELYERVQNSREGERHFYPVLLDADWSAEGVLKDEEALCLDATYYGNVGRFINHRCYDSNLVEIPVEVETPDHHYYHLAYFTTRKVKAMEELNWDYGIDFDDVDHPVKAFQCKCGSKFCRNIKRTRTRSSSRLMIR